MSPPNAALLTPKLEPHDGPPTVIPPAEEYSDIYAEFLRVHGRFSAAFSSRTAASPSLPIVPSPSSAPRALAPSPARHRAAAARSSEMVRVAALDAEQERHFRGLVRRTRMTYEALRIFISRGEGRAVEEQLGVPRGRRRRADLKAATVMKGKGMWLNRERRIVGSIPGVCVGDAFFYRMELCVVGLHGQIQAGIDYVGPRLTPNGYPVATSIIVSGGYEDDDDSGDVLVYTGHGGKQRNLLTHSIDQKLQGGNLALERSRHFGIEIRVIRGIQCEGSPSGKIYIYDGLYKVTDHWFDVGKSGFGVYKYRLVRLPKQPQMGTVIFKHADELKTRPLAVRPKGYLNMDMSQGKEKMPVYFFNDVDGDCGPLYFQYAVSPVHGPFSFGVGGVACDCVHDCSTGCKCIERNGGEEVYDRDGVLLRGRPVIYECGMLCKCPPSCSNRVSQRGLKHRLEVFRCRETTWGVRSLDPIRAGECICEYSGIVLTSEQAAIMSMNGESSLIYPNRFPCRWKEWGDLTPVMPDFGNQHLSCVPPLNFAVDVSRIRNVACYISHSSCPNVMVQVVAYNQNSMVCPHLVLYSMESIPPLRELSIDYGITNHRTQVLCIDIKPSSAELL